MVRAMVVVGETTALVGFEGAGGQMLALPHYVLDVGAGHVVPAVESDFYAGFFEEADSRVG
jgi:hypothetical protein